jgi:hypothetical protein
MGKLNKPQLVLAGVVDVGWHLFAMNFDCVVSTHQFFGPGVGGVGDVGDVGKARHLTKSYCPRSQMSLPSFPPDSWVEAFMKWDKDERDTPEYMAAREEVRKHYEACDL